MGYTNTPLDDPSKIPSITTHHAHSYLDYINYDFFDKTIADLAKAKPSDVQEIAASQIKLLNSYYIVALNQSQRSFLAAMVAAVIGLSCFIGTAIFLVYQQSQSVALAISFGGALSTFISSINFYQYNKSTAQLAEFHDKLDITQRFLLANSICEGLEEDFKQKARSELVRIIAGGLTTPTPKI
jgi:hypothetical protein